jgi:hypothetical protein
MQAAFYENFTVTAPGKERKRHSCALLKIWLSDNCRDFGNMWRHFLPLSQNPPPYMAGTTANINEPKILTYLNGGSILSM